MRKTTASIEGLVVIEPEVYGDDRGYFYESYNLDKFKALGIDAIFVQDNHSYSAKGILRGLHFQLPPKPMAKLVRCTRGRLWDVAVDIRKDSPTYLKWHAEELSEENKKMLYVPVGFAHGFYALEDCELLYKCSNMYDGDLDANVQWNDPAFGIDWPVEGEPTLSGRDQSAPAFNELDLPF
ncbi:MAG: dTDP-4-dehydrorhamnose 3,5-epimerase [Candidatus Uhrbacteria bacterium]|nr:dTDP-4-dehydrorhamnose 3,5-epimerase [Candidatus Uhrbacteria bacterium]